LWQGCFDALGGRVSQGRMMWTACITQAGRLALPYEAARAHYALGRSLGAADPAGAGHLDNAERGFRAIDARFELARAEAARRGEEGVAMVW
jgi:hypothetical protein